MRGYNRKESWKKTAWTSDEIWKTWTHLGWNQRIGERQAKWRQRVWPNAGIDQNVG